MLTFCILTNSPIYVKAKKALGCPLYNRRDHKSEFLNYVCISASENCFDHSKMCGPDGMQQSAAFHLGLHCLPDSQFMGF